ncbi:hypothetical protein K491DRAFT_110064 [Lophiostoma macrostomum CBS 122681]|uniref:Uncharacterized protein n=1 Tax=Lophiostoma macrostomum CBS 122681 TaxID=1314788 RepID=A0A6A6TLC3_9PLEO|nr:hypothetical protein K491DRAFT_110064 [Lophiostoma macrostomum CBS 122681]
MGKVKPTYFKITVREAGIHRPPNVRNLEAYKALPDDEKFGLPVKRETLTGLPTKILTIWYPSFPSSSYCKHLLAEEEKDRKRNDLWTCDSGTCYLLLVDDEHKSIKEATATDKGFLKAWPRQWFGTGIGPAIRDGKVVQAHESVKCIERDDDKKAGSGRTCACPTFYEFNSCACSPALRGERMERLKKTWRQQEEKEESKENGNAKEMATMPEVPKHISNMGKVRLQEERDQVKRERLAEEEKNRAKERELEWAEIRKAKQEKQEK